MSIRSFVIGVFRAGQRSWRHSPVAVAVVASLLASSVVCADDLLDIGFEPPDYVTGTLNGQNGWTIMPGNASGLVQESIVHSGKQAVALTDSSSFSSAEKTIDADLAMPLLSASYDMLVPLEWADNDSSKSEDRFEAQVKLSCTDDLGVKWTFEFGLLRTPFDAPYRGLPADTVYYYIEITNGGLVVDSAYAEVQLAEVTDSWHLFRLVIERNTRLVKLFVDGEQVADRLVNANLSTIDVIELRNQRWGSGSLDDRPLYFDNALLREFVPSDVVGMCELEKLLASDGEAGDRFGDDVAISGDVMVVSARLDDDNGDASGSAYVYRFDPATGLWQEAVKLAPTDPAPGQEFGHWVDVSGDVIVAGARLDDQLVTDGGAAYVFRFDDDAGTWIQEVKLVASDEGVDDRFGGQVAIDGSLIIASSHRDDDNGADSGSAYVYRYDEGMSEWIEEAKLRASDAAQGDEFGAGIDLEGDVAVVGARLNDDDGSNSGAAYVFRYDADAETWSQEAKLTANDAGEDDRFGTSVRVSGEVVVVGAPRADASGTNSGAAYVFRFDAGSGSWQQETRLLGSSTVAGDRFGAQVAISGARILVAGRLNDAGGENAGAAYLFEFDESTGLWSETAALVAPDAGADDRFGLAIALTGDRLVVGAGLDDDTAENAGSVYALDLACSPIDLLAVEVLEGSLLDGGLAELLDSDDAVLHTRSQLGFSAFERNVMRMVLKAATEVQAPSTMRVRVEARIDNPGGNTVVSVLNLSTGLFDIAGEFPVGTTQEVGSIANIPTTSHINGDGQIKFSVKHVVLATFSALGFDSFIDHVAISSRH